MFTTIQYWIKDYAHALKMYAQTLTHKDAPEHYLGYIDTTKVPIILIPGVNTKWHFLKKIADDISKIGHPVHTIKELGHNRLEIGVSAKIVRQMIDANNLHNVIILAHSKGGLIGKEVLLNYNLDQRVIKMVAIASPFGGSTMASFVPDKAIKELSPASQVVQIQHENTEVNQAIISIYGMYDNHVWPTESAVLEGAENIQVNTDGHHQILSSEETKAVVLTKVAEIAASIRESK